MICFPLSKSPVGLVRFGAHRCPPTSPFMVPRSRLRGKQASLEVMGACRPHPALCGACLGPVLCLRHVCAPWPPPASPPLLCLGFCVQTTEERAERVLPSSTPSRYPSVHLHTAAPSRRPAPAAWPPAGPAGAAAQPLPAAAPRKAGSTGCSRQHGRLPSGASPLISPENSDFGSGTAREGGGEGMKDLGWRQKPAADTTTMHTPPWVILPSLSLTPAHECALLNMSPRHPYPTNCHHSFYLITPYWDLRFYSRPSSLVPTQARRSPKAELTSPSPAHSPVPMCPFLTSIRIFNRLTATYNRLKMRIPVRNAD